MSDARQRTLAHLQALVTAAAVVGAGSSTTACKKLLEKAKGDGDADAASDGASAASVPSASSSADPNATAESTLDATAFADAGEVQARMEAGAPRDAGVGYRVVDPMPHPARLPKDCNPPFTIDKDGKKHYKPKCLGGGDDF